MAKYPLRPLLEYRDRQVHDATTSLGTAIREREAAERAREQAERAKQSAEEHAERVRADERERLARGELTAADLARGGAWEIAARAEVAQLTDAANAAEQKTEARVSEEAGARTTLAQTMADREVIEKDRARFDARVKARAIAAEEEAAEEAWKGHRS